MYGREAEAVGLKEGIGESGWKGWVVTCTLYNVDGDAGKETIRAYFISLYDIEFSSWPTTRPLKSESLVRDSADQSVG